MLVPRNATVTWGLTLSSGVLLGLSYPPSPLPFLAWIAWMPLLGVWRRIASARRMMVHAYGAWLATYAVAFYWPLAHVRTDTALLSLNGLLLLPLLLALPLALAVLVRRRWGCLPSLGALIAFQLSIEWILSRGPLAFPWSLLGHTQAELFPVNELAALAGVPGLTLWVLLLNGMGWYALRTASHRRRLVGGLAVLGLVLAPLGYSAARRAALRAAPASVHIGLLQPAIPAPAWADVHDRARVDTLLALTDRLLASTATQPALMIWPETALPVLAPASTRTEVLSRLQAWVNQHGVPLLTGAITIAPHAPNHYQNSAVLLQPGRSIQRHDKIKLVPLAEYVPYAERLSWLKAFAVPAGGVSGYVPGGRHAPLRVGRPEDPLLQLGVLICFESLFGNYVRRYLEQEADLLVTLSQDGWWGPTPGYRQHLAFTRLRAIETGRALVHVTVSGMSALVYPDGRSTFELGWMERAARIVEVPLYRAGTPYARWGDGLSYLALVASLLIGLGLLRTRERAPG